ncbi:MAG: cysteine desulfurase family protein [Paenibacillaceae bacterium]
MMDSESYYDYSASTPPYKEVIDVVADLMHHYYGNPSSLHRKGFEAEKLMKQAREVIAACIHTDVSHIVFTSGGTESNNMAIMGCARQFASRGKHLITSRIEHSSVYECYQQLEREGFDVTYVPVDQTGSVDANDIIQAIREDTILVSIMHVNNETGRIQPIEAIGHELAKHPRIFFHVDGVQGAGKIPIYPEQIGIDLLSLSAHKFHGPKGIGILYRRPNIRLAPILFGGGQEFGIRPGTENVPLIVGMAKALRMGTDKLVTNKMHVSQLRKSLINQLKLVDGLILTGSEVEADMIPHIVHFCLPGIKSEVFVHAMEAAGLYVSAQSACASGEDKPSRTLLAMGFDQSLAKSGIRISLDPLHSLENIRHLAESVAIVSKQLL